MSLCSGEMRLGRLSGRALFGRFGGAIHDAMSASDPASLPWLEPRRFTATLTEVADIPQLSDGPHRL